MKNYLFFFLLISWTSFLRAQDIVHGKVIDSESDNPLYGATVKIKSTGASTSTDEKGQFALRTLDSAGVLVISFVGHKTAEIGFSKAGRGPFEILLTESTNTLRELSVSTGYQTLPKDRATGSFAQPIKEMYNDRVSTDVLSRLSGITSGLVFNANTSAAQTGLDINIRGRSTIFADDQPLIVVDNFPYSGDIKNINPNDVESVTILKDAASASIWGVRAGNGVIVITTKKGKINNALKVGFNANLTVFNKPDLNYNPNQLNAASFIGMEKYLFSQGYYDASLSDAVSYPVISPAVQLFAANRAGSLSNDALAAQLNALGKININDQLGKYFYRNAVNQQYALNLSGGSDKAVYYFSAGYDNDLSGLKDNGTQRITINTQNTFYPVKNLEISLGLNAIQTNNRVDPTLTRTSGFLFPYTQIADDKGNPLPIAYGYNQSYVQNAPAAGFLDWSYSPLKELGEPNDRTRDNDIRLSTGLKYTFIPGLSGEIKYQYQNANLQTRDLESLETYYTRNLINEYAVLTNGTVSGYNVPVGGILNLANNNVVSNNVRAQLNYELNWKNNSITALAGYELSQTTDDYNSSTLYGYNDNNATFSNIDAVTSFATNPSGNPSTINSGLGTASTIDRFRSLFANAAYTYKDRYIFSGSARVDGSNYFGVAINQKSLPLWSAGAKWAIYKEEFYKRAWLPVLSLRATYGYNGNLDRAVTGVTTFAYRDNALYTNLPYAEISNIGNPDLQWEKTAIANLAIDFGTKNNTVTGSLEYYFKKETDLLGYKNFPANTGITTLEGNYSDMSGRGFDLSITTQNLNGDLKWSTTLFLSHATDKVTRYAITPYAPTLVAADGNQTLAAPVLGKPVFGLYSYKWGGLDPANGNPVGYLNGVKSEDYGNIVNNTAIRDLVYSGTVRPTYFGGLHNRFSYKGFNLAVQINYKFGYYFRKPALNYYNITSSGIAFLRVNRDFDRRWMKPGDEKNTDVPSVVYPFDPTRDQFYQFSSVNVEKGDHIRLQDISLSYDFSRSRYSKLPFSHLQLFIYGNNLGILWRANHSGIDPDAVPSDYNTMPNRRSFSFGLKGGF